MTVPAARINPTQVTQVSKKKLRKKKLREEKIGTRMGKNGEKWGKMGKEFYGESILRLAIFPIFPHFSPLAPPRHTVSAHLTISNTIVTPW